MRAPHGSAGVAVKIGVSYVLVALVVVLTIVAATYRVSTAPERIRMRLNAAKESCLNGGGEWIKVGNEEACRANAERKKV